MDAAVHRDEAVDVRLVLHRRVVQTRVQHDDGERQHVAGVCTCKQTSTHATRDIRETNHKAASRYLSVKLILECHERKLLTTHFVLAS